MENTNNVTIEGKRAMNGLLVPFLMLIPMVMALTNVDLKYVGLAMWVVMFIIPIVMFWVTKSKYVSLAIMVICYFLGGFFSAVMPFNIVDKPYNGDSSVCVDQHGKHIIYDPKKLPKGKIIMEKELFNVYGYSLSKDYFIVNDFKSIGAISK